MGDRPILAVVTVVLLILLLVAVCLATWWSDRRVAVLEERMLELERLNAKVEGFRQEVGKDLARLRGMEESLGNLQKSLGPMAKIDHNMDVLTEKVSKDVAPDIEKIADLATGLTTTSSQLKALSDSAAASLQLLMDRVGKQGTDTTDALGAQTKSLIALETELKGMSDAQAGLLVELAKLETHLQAMSDTQTNTTNAVDEVKTLAEQISVVQRSVEGLRKQMEDVQRRLPESKK